MPTYEYECKNCGRFETVHKMSEGSTGLPHWRKEIRKLISSSLTVIYKGSGFHTDYRMLLQADASDCAGSSSVVAAVVVGLRVMHHK